PSSANVSFVAPAIKSRRRKARKSATPVVESSVRRCTRSLHKKEGFRAGNLFELPSPPKKKRPRSKPMGEAHMPKPTVEAHKGVPEEQHSDHNIPPTPIKVLQQIGADLEIEEDLLSKDRLEAGPTDKDS